MLSAMLKPQKKWFVFLMLLVAAAGFRVAVAHWLPNDAPDDGRTYAQIARNVLEQHVYSHETAPPYDPSYIRLPGYPLFLAAVYSIFGHTNNAAVRIVQALIDTGTCALVALLAFYWQPDERRKRVTAIAALALAAVCPFTTIYAATILTEVPTNFFVLAMCLAATLAFRNGFTTEDTEGSLKDHPNLKQALFWWSIAGLLGGVAVLLRPDCGLFVAAIGFTLVITTIWTAVASARGPRRGSRAGVVVARRRFGSSLEVDQPAHDPKRRRRFALPAHSKISRTLVAGAVFSVAFALALTPWTIRNWRVFHSFQPLAPAHGEMPGEFVSRGYNLWLRTWLDDERYIGPFEWDLDEHPIDIEELPAYAFDSVREKERVEALVDKYNHPPNTQVANDNGPQSQAAATPQPSPTQTPMRAKVASDKATPSPTTQSQRNAGSNSNTNSKAEETSDENGQNGDQGDEGNDESESDQENGPVEMTPEIDAGFAQIARERIARHPFRFYVWLPIKRAGTMWLDTHSQYWPFDGRLLPLEDLDYEHHQQFWLPLFAALVGIYTLTGLAGAFVLWLSGDLYSRSWLLLVFLTVVTRLAFFSTLENPEPRYVVEFFPFLAALGGIAFARIWKRSTPNRLLKRSPLPLGKG